MEIKPESLLGDLVAADYRFAAVLSTYGLDYCCHGNRTLAEACQEQNVSVEEVLNNLSKASEVSGASGSGPINRYTKWPLPLLVDYILENHHVYVEKMMPTIRAGLEKLSKVHGERHPELKEILSLFSEMTVDLQQHMWKEENVLFPYIRAALSSGDLPWPKVPFQTIDTPINAMRTEHEREGVRLFKLRELSRNYSIPHDGCATYRATYRQLAEFDRDLIQHIHIENNILFPRAIAETANHPQG